MNSYDFCENFVNIGGLLPGRANTVVWEPTGGSVKFGI